MDPNKPFFVLTLNRNFARFIRDTRDMVVTKRRRDRLNNHNGAAWGTERIITR